MIKKLLLTTILGVTTFLYAKVNTVVSVLPQKTFVEMIGKDKVNVALMVKPGNSPHTYEPKPSQMKDINNADIYFSIGVEFETAWLPKFISQNKKMQISDMTKGVEKLPMQEHHHGEEDHHQDEEDTLDPHIWTSPANVKIIAKNIYESLIKIDIKNKEYYKTNYENFLAHIKQTDAAIKKILLKSTKDTKFMVFHPAWGYFARDYQLVQIAIEAGGKNPKPKQIAYLIKEAKHQQVKAIFTAPEFSDKAAVQIAKEVGVPVKKISPLNPNWSQNLIKLAEAIAIK